MAFDIVNSDTKHLEITIWHLARTINIFYLNDVFCYIIMMIINIIQAGHT